MNVATLQQFLRSLVPALQSSDARLGQDLERACRGLDPFRALDLDAFAGFLVRCEELQRTGAIPAPTGFDLAPVEQPLRRLGAILQKLEAPDAKSHLTGAQGELAEGLLAVAKSAGLSKSLKPEPKWADQQVARGRSQAQVRAIRELAAKIDGPAAYEREEVRADMHRLEHEIPAKEWKPLAVEFGAAAASKPAKALGEILAKLTGHRPEKAKPARKAAAIDPAKVAQFAEPLKALLERSKDPKAVTDEEIDAELNKLETLDAKELLAAAREAGIDNPGRGKAAILNKVRDRLTAAKRVMEETQV